ncbi:bL17 family ribosomal protein [Alienimonas californiensis]|uniref:Large ribosomal subunit protein bL17 n=1 Tax=Alienimonas californiensis TaxID=2527989 RepID=A0A517P9L9_9PLAN|nr:bL17 family ribosomal protein [Alienimonas californiensis]QDT16055.1 50S ribosomal protein L17 [Alienimonas californiensis]
MRHRMRGRKLGRNASHRKAMFKNMASSLIRSVRPDEDDPGAPLVAGRIVTTTPKAKELRPFVEKLITIGKKARIAAAAAEEHATSAERGSAEWKQWREGEGWLKWTAARAPYVALRRRAFSKLRDEEAVDILFEELAERFESRPGGYTRIVRLAARRLGDGGEQALIEFVGEDDARSRSGRKRTAPVVRDDAPKVVADKKTAGPSSDEADASGPPPEAPETAEGKAAEGAAADEQPRNQPE